MANAEDRPRSTIYLKGDKKTSRNIFTRFGRTISRAFHHKRRSEASHHAKSGEYRAKSSSELDRDIGRESALSASIDDLHQKPGSGQARCVSEGDLLSPGLFHRQDSENPFSNSTANSGHIDRKNFKNELSSKLLLRLNSSEDNRISASMSSSSSPLCSPSITATRPPPSTTSGESGSLDFAMPTPADSNILDSSASKNKLAVARQRHRRHAPTSAVSQRISATSDILTNIQEEEVNGSNEGKNDVRDASQIGGRNRQCDSSSPGKKPSVLSAKPSLIKKPDDVGVKVPPKINPKPKSFIRRPDSNPAAGEGRIDLTDRISKSTSSHFQSSVRPESFHGSMSKSLTLPVATSGYSKSPEIDKSVLGSSNNKRPFSVHDSLQSDERERSEPDPVTQRPQSKRHTIEFGKDSSLLFTNRGKSKPEETLNRTRQHQSMKLTDSNNLTDNEEMTSSNNKRSSTVLDLIKNFQNIQATT